MNEETALPSNRDEARAALAEVDKILAQTRLAIAQGPSAQLLILWGSIWMIADVTTQFYPPAMQWLWLVLDVIGIGGSCWLGSRQRLKVKRPGAWRYGAFWGILFFYAFIWMNLLVQTQGLHSAQGWEVSEPVYRKLTAYLHTIPMFAYVVGGLWFGRFFIWLGAIVTALILLGYYFIPDYFYLWLAVTGGGSLIVAGVFIRKFWK